MNIAMDIQTIKRQARTAGWWYLALAAVSVFGMLYIPSKLIVSGDAAATARKIMDSEFLFRLGTLSVIVGQIIFIFLALSLYNLFKRVNKNHARSLVALVITAVAAMFVITLNQVAALITVEGPSYLNSFSAEQLNALSMFFLDMYSHGGIIVGFFWGLWLLPFGYLAYRSGFIPKLLGLLLIVGCIGYVLDATLYVLSPGVYETVSKFMTILESVGEPLMMLWLVIFGARMPKMKTSEARDT